MKVYWNEISDQEMELDFTQDEPWVLKAVCRVDERSPLEAAASAPPARSIEAHYSLRKVDEVVVISGSIHTSIELLCSRCAAQFQLPCNPHFSALFCRDPVMAGVAHLEKDAPGGSRPAGQNQGKARHAHDFEADEDDSGGESSGKDLDITYLTEDFIDLADVLTEQLQFQIPFQPLCKSDCKGICSNCGTDLNQGRCACAKLAKDHPFKALANLKF